MWTGCPSTTTLPTWSCYQQQSHAEEASLQDHTNIPVPSQASVVLKATNSANSKDYISCFSVLLWPSSLFPNSNICQFLTRNDHQRSKSNILCFTQWYVDSYQNHIWFFRYTSTLTASVLSSFPNLVNSFFYPTTFPLLFCLSQKFDFTFDLIIFLMNPP